MKIKTGIANVIRCSFDSGDWHDNHALEIDLNPIDLSENLLSIQVYREFYNAITETKPLIRIHNNIIMITKPRMTDNYNGFVSVMLLSPVV